MKLVIGLGLLASLLAHPAQAEWLQASSAHFVVYANSTERNVRKLSEQLERYHSAMSVVTNLADIPPSPSNRVTVYVVSGEEEVRRLYGDASQNIGGFYRPRAGGSLAIVPRVSTATGAGSYIDFSMVVLLHEYAHHFMITASPAPMPRWYMEGSAEFFASASFDSKGGVGIGRPAQHRAIELLIPGAARQVSVSELLDPPKRDRRRSREYGAFYGKSWLLFHYLVFSKERSGQLRKYLELLGQGKSSRDAGIAAFGDFAQLERELARYLNARLLMIQLPAAQLKTGPVELRRLSPGEAAIMPVRIRSQRGVNEAQAKTLLAEARDIAGRFPGDPAVLAALAEAEHDAGNDAEAIAAADGAIAKDPSQVNAYIQKGLSLFRLADKASDRPAAYSAAQRAFVALNRRESDHPLPLIFYYRSFVAQGKEPSQLAIDGLSRAADIAPFDTDLLLTLAIAQIRRGQGALARKRLLPVAFNPHGGRNSNAAQQLLARMDADPKWDGRDATQLVAAAKDDED